MPEPMTPEERQADWKRRRREYEEAQAAKRAESDAKYKRERVFADACKAAGPGGTVLLTDGTELIVGHVNEQGGECDDCPYDLPDGVDVKATACKGEVIVQVEAVDREDADV